MTNMNEDPTTTNPGVSRRTALIGAAAAAGAAAVVSAVPFKANASSLSAILTQESAGDLGPTIPGLTYVGLDAFAFTTELPGVTSIYQTLTGIQPLPAANRIWAPLTIPAGSVVHQMNVGYQGQPIAEISRRKVTQPNPALIPSQSFQKSLAAGPGGPFSSTENLATPVTIEQDSTYTVSFFCSAGASVFGCTVGYLPPTQSFVPFTGTPRVLDTRIGGAGPLALNEERVVDLGIPGARSAVINLTIAQTTGQGFVAVFPGDIGWPGNSSINWFEPNSFIANGVITRVDPTGKIKIRCGGAGTTHVVIDRLGYLM